ncbi:hypothetical protein IAT38_007386 [Cryptococcus sp. DSM 104549]
MAGLQPTTSSHDLLADADADESPPYSAAASSSSSSAEPGATVPADNAGEGAAAALGGKEAGASTAQGEAKEEDLADAAAEAAEADEVVMDVQSEDAAAQIDESGMDIAELGGDRERKRVKVYELRDTSWYDRGTGFCRGIFDESTQVAKIIVEAEDPAGEDKDGPGGFLKEELLLSTQVEKDDIYGKQQDTLIVWTEPGGLDIALSFQDADGCEDTWQFIVEVRKHLISHSTDPENMPSSSSPVGGSPMMGVGSSHMAMGNDSGLRWQIPSLANIREQELLLRMQAKSPMGRERAMEHILGEDYIKHLITVLEQAEDLESIEDLHALCSLMQTILLFNDNGIFEYILQDEIFLGVIGMLEYDPEFPDLKASYRQFFIENARFREVVEIKDPNIRNKIHQTYRLLYLKDVVLARVLDDPTFNILNGFVFFNQVDIITYIQSNDAFLQELYEPFHDLHPDASVTASEPLDERKRDTVLFMHQLMLMGKGIQVAGRLQLYRNLTERGLMFVCEWAFRRHEAKLLHAGAEMLTLAAEHDANVVRLHVFKEEEARKKTLVQEIIGLLHTTKNLGLMSQMADTLRTLLETPSDGEAFMPRKEAPLSDTFGTYFYENCATLLFKPLLDAPEFKPEEFKGNAPKLPREYGALLQHLVELLSFCVTNHAHRASYFILSNPISKKVVGLLYVRDKPLRHAALRFVRACLKTPNHFIHRYFVKNDLLAPVISLLEDESTRDNMMCSACMDVIDQIRKDNLKSIINYLFESYSGRLDRLGHRPLMRNIILGIRSRWEMNNEPPPPPPAMEAESSKAWAHAHGRVVDARDEEDYFNGSDEEEIIGPKATPGHGGEAASGSVSMEEVVPAKRKRMFAPGGGGPKKRNTRSGAAQPQALTTTAAASPSSGGGALGLDYDDGSDSDSSGGASPRNQPRHLEHAPSPTPSAPNTSTGSAGALTSTSLLERTATRASEARERAITPPEELEAEMGDVAMRMRAKRQREAEDEEEGFGGLMVGKPPAETEKEKEEAAADAAGEDALKEETKKGGPIKDMGKKIRLSFGLGKKAGGK